MPTIITAHIAKARATSAAVHGVSIAIAMPISAIMRSCSIAADISRSRWKRYAHASAVSRTRQVGDDDAIAARREPWVGRTRNHSLSAFPGEGRVLTVVLPADVIPGQAERFDVALRRARERERVRGRMTGVLELQLGSGFNPLAPVAAMSTKFAALTDHVAPLRSNAIGADSTPRNLPISPDKAAIGPPAAPLAIAVIASRCSALARGVGDEPDRPVALAHFRGRQTEDDKGETVERDGAEFPVFDLERHRELAVAFGRLHRQLAGQARTDEIAIAGFVVLAVHGPGWCRHATVILQLSMVLARAAVIALLVLASTRTTAADEATIRLLKVWIDAVHAHVPGTSDPAAGVDLDVEPLTDLIRLRPFVQRAGWIGSGSAQGAGQPHPDAERRCALKCALLATTALDGRSANEFVKRAALLHTDVVLLGNSHPTAPTLQPQPRQSRRETSGAASLETPLVIARGPDGRFEGHGARQSELGLRARSARRGHAAAGIRRDRRALVSQPSAPTSRRSIRSARPSRTSSGPNKLLPDDPGVLFGEARHPGNARLAAHPGLRARDAAARPAAIPVGHVRARASRQGRAAAHARDSIRSRRSSKRGFASAA